MTHTVWRFFTAIPPVPPQALAAFHTAVGVAILAGDTTRFAGPSFAGARQLANLLFGCPEDKAWILWGTLLTVVGVTVLFTWPWLERHHPRLALVAVLFGAAPMIFVTIGFIASLQQSDEASTSGIGAYGALAAAHLHTSWHMIRHGVWDQRRLDGTWERRRVRTYRGGPP